MRKIINIFIVVIMLMASSLSFLATENSEIAGEGVNDTSLDLVSGDEGKIESDIDFEDLETKDLLIEPFEVVVDGDVKLSIAEYSSVDKWAIFEHYDMNVEVNFGTENVEKKVTIKLAEGMRYVSYPVPQSMTRTDIQTPAQGVLNDMIQAIEVPTYTLWNQWNGELTYSFNSDTIGVIIPLKVAVDEFIFHTSQTLIEAINVDATKDGVSIGSAKMDIDTLGNYAENLFSNNILNDISVLAGENVTFRFMRRRIIGNNGKGITYPEDAIHYSKKMTFRFYYPPGTSYVSSNYEMNKTIHDDILGYVEFEFIDSTLSPRIDITVSTVGVPSGTYLATNQSYIKSVMYDDSEIMSTLTPLRLGIVVNDIIENKVDFSILGNVEYYQYSDDYESNGPVPRIANNSSNIKTNQWIEIEVPNEYLATQIVIPYDRDANNISDLKIWYETSDDIGIWKEVTSLSQITVNVNSVRVSTQSLAITGGITLTKIKAYIGNVGAYFESTPRTSMRATFAASPKIVGKLEDGMVEATFKGATYAAPLGEVEQPETRVESNGAKVIRTNAPTTSILQQMNNVSVVAGEAQKETLVLNSLLQYSGLTAIVNPEIYLRVPEGISYSNPRVISITGGIATISEPYYTTTGEKIVKITTNNVKVGTAFGGNLDLRPRIEFDVVADFQVHGGTYQWSDYLFLKDDVSNFTYYYMHPNPQADIYDVNNNGDLTEMTVSPRFGNTLTVYPLESLIIDTYIVPQGENRYPNYDGTDATTVGFTPGATAKYTVDIFNNNVDPLTGFEAYIPVPKVGNNFGTNFQTEAFEWNMRLAGAPTIKVVDENDVDITTSRGSNYQITYSTNATAEANYNSATYSSTYNANATMIKIENTTSTPRGERAYLEFEYAIDETNSTIEANPERLNSINDFRPYYSFSAGGNIGAARGTMAGVKLVLGQISGIIFKDENYNGIYDAGENLLGAKTVDLYLKNASNVYEYVDTTTTDINGAYDFSGIGNGLYKVDFSGVLGITERFTRINVGSDETIDSDVEFIGGNGGAVIDVSPAAISSKTISAGIVTYEMPTITITNGATITTQAVNAQYPNISKELIPAITPTYFEQIKATTNTISWTSSDIGIVTVDTSGYIYGQAVGTTTVTATITDIYGGTSTATIAVTVTGNNIPVITAPATLQIEYGTTYNPLVNGGVTITDVEDGAITLTGAMVVSSVPVDGSNRAMTVGGPYNVVYTYTDTDANTVTATVAVTVVDTQNPTLTIATPIVTIEAATGVMPTDWHVAFGLSATDPVDGVLPATSIHIDVPGTLTSNMDMGTHTFNITATDRNGNTATGTATVVVQDTVGPVITINGPTPKIVEAGVETLPTDWIAEFNVTAHDAVDGVINLTTANVQVPVVLTSNTSLGVHTIAFGGGLVDGAGNPATIVTAVYEIEDTEGPEITIAAPNNKITVEAGAVPLPTDWVTEFGITAFDVTDGLISVLASNVQVPTTLTSNIAVGLHEFTITIVDDEGNQATATTYYEIVDTTAPVITLTELSPKTVEAGSEALPTDWLTEFGVSATDIVDGSMALTAINTVVTVPTELTSNIVLGTHVINISVTDTNLNTGTILVTYIIEDTTKPVINVTTPTITAESGDELPTDWVAAFGITAVDIVDGPITVTEAEHLTIPSLLTETAVGSHTFIITVADAEGNSETAYTTYVIQDSGSPIITIGTSPIVVESGTETLPTNWTEWVAKFGITVIDTTDGTIALIENNIAVPSTLTSNTAVGIHHFVITVEDSSGNQATATAIYEIEDTTAPTITIGTSAIYVGKDDVKTEQELINLAVVGANDVSGTEVVTLDQSQVDYSTEGIYTVIVVAVDAYGNQSTETFTVEVVELINANNFIVELSKVADADFVTLAGAVGWEADTNPAALTTSVVTLESSKPTTVGLHTATFATAEGISKTIDVLVTTQAIQTPPAGTVAEHIEAKDFAIDLASVTGADFVQLADAVGYEITADVAGNISFAIIPVTLASDKPTTVGIHPVTFTTANGTTATVSVYVTAEPITPPLAGTTAEMIIANDFTVDLLAIEIADFVVLANVQGFVVDENLFVVDTGLPVTLTSSKPTTAGAHTATFATAGGATTTVAVEVTDVGAYIELTAVDTTVSLKDIQKATADGVLEAYIIEKTEATAVLHTATEVIDLPVSVDTAEIENATTAGDYSVELIATTVVGGHMASSMLVLSQGTIFDEYNLTEARTVTVKLSEDIVTSEGNNNITDLPSTGEPIIVALLLGVILLLSAIILLFFIRNSQQKGYK